MLGSPCVVLKTCLALRRIPAASAPQLAIKLCRAIAPYPCNSFFAAERGRSCYNTAEDGLFTCSVNVIVVPAIEWTCENEPSRCGSVPERQINGHVSLTLPGYVRALLPPSKKLLARNPTQPSATSRPKMEYFKRFIHKPSIVDYSDRRIAHSTHQAPARPLVPRKTWRQAPPAVACELRLGDSDECQAMTSHDITLRAVHMPDR